MPAASSIVIHRAMSLPVDTMAPAPLNLSTFSYGMTEPSML